MGAEQDRSGRDVAGNVSDTGMRVSPYELADRIVAQLREIAPFAADDRFWQQARALIATEITLGAEG